MRLDSALIHVDWHVSMGDSLTERTPGALKEDLINLGIWDDSEQRAKLNYGYARSIDV